MFDYQLAKVEKKIKGLTARGFFRDKRIYLFGVSDNTRQTIGVLRGCGVEPAFVLDNDSMKQGTCCSGLPVISLRTVENAGGPRNVYVICSAYWREMKAQLRDKGVRRKRIVILYEEESLAECFYQAAAGRRIYQRLTAQYGKVPIFVCPYTGTGDIYLIGTFWKQYTEKNQVGDYIFTVISRACEKVARLFQIKNVVVFEQKAACACLLRYDMLCPGEGRLVVLNDSWKQHHTNPLEGFRGYKGLGFSELFRKFVFDLPDTARPQHPVFESADREVREVFEKSGLKEGNTVLLSPYSNTLADLPGAFWVSLAGRLKAAGFTVCTNSSKESEPAVEGTAPVFFSLDIAPQLVSRAGYFIGIRSGFCDVISGAQAKKVILYHAGERFFNSSTFEYFSLREMGLCGDAVELQFEQGNEELCGRVIEAVLNGRGNV